MRRLAAVNNPPSGYDFDDHAWLAARDRLSLYLDALKLPQAEAERLLESALSQAHAAAPVMPLPAAMAALQGLLAARETTLPAVPMSMPELHRGPMVPELIERSPLRFLVSEFLRPVMLGSARLAAGNRHRLLMVCTSLIAGLLLNHHIG